MKIRRAIQSDARLLAELNRHVQAMHVAAVPAVFKPHEQAEIEESFYTDFLPKENVYILIAFEDDGEAVGYVVAQILERGANPYTYTQRWLSIEQIGVLPAHQGKGVGKLLVQAILSYAQEQEITIVQAGIWYFNDVSKAFFQSLGFTQRQEQVWLHLESTSESVCKQ